MGLQPLATWIRFWDPMWCHLLIVIGTTLFSMTTLVFIQQDPHIEVMPWPVLIPELKPIEHLWVRFKDDLAKPSQGRQLQLNTVHPSWWFGLVFLWDISFNVQEMCSALINDNVGHTRYWLSFLISSYSLMHCWQKFRKSAWNDIQIFIFKLAIFQNKDILNFYLYDVSLVVQYIKALFMQTQKPPSSFDYVPLSFSCKSKGIFITWERLRRLWRHQWGNQNP